jgi:hypothetical protein
LFAHVPDVGDGEVKADPISERVSLRNAPPCCASHSLLVAEFLREHNFLLTRDILDLYARALASLVMRQVIPLSTYIPRGTGQNILDVLHRRRQVAETAGLLVAQFILKLGNELDIA